jgi:hypothetical protein
MPDGVSVPPVEPVAVRYRLISLPLYVAGELPRLVSQLEGRPGRWDDHIDQISFNSRPTWCWVLF